MSAPLGHLQISPLLGFLPSPVLEGSRPRRQERCLPPPPASVTDRSLRVCCRTVYSAQCTAYSAQCTVHSVHCTVYTPQCTLHSAQWQVAGSIQWESRLLEGPRSSQGLRHLSNPPAALVVGVGTVSAILGQESLVSEIKRHHGGERADPERAALPELSTTEHGGRGEWSGEGRGGRGGRGGWRWRWFNRYSDVDKIMIWTTLELF